MLQSILFGIPDGSGRAASRAEERRAITLLAEDAPELRFAHKIMASTIGAKLIGPAAPKIVWLKQGSHVLCPRNG